MAELTISRTFSAEHGTSSRHITCYEVQVMISGDVILGFTNHCNTALLERRLDAICADLENNYLDERMGRATHEMVAFWIFQHIGVVIDRVTVSGDQIITTVNRNDFLRHNYDSVLCQQKATSAFLQGDLAIAETLLNKAIQKDTDNEEAYLLRGRVYRYTGEYVKAIDDFRKVIQLRPKWSEGYRNMGNMLLFQGQYEAMLPYFREAVRLAPYSSLAANNLGYACGCAEQWEDAYHFCLRAVELNPVYYEAYLDLACACENLERYDNAEHYRDIASHLKSARSGYQLADEEDELILYAKIISFDDEAS